LAIDTKMKEGSVDIELVGKDHIDNSKMAWIMKRVCGRFDIALHIIFKTHGVSLENKVASFGYCRGAMVIIDQNRRGDRE
jgi:hypothetical protein